MLTARRMFEKLKSFNPELIEQPIPRRTGSEGLSRLRAVTNIPIAADQTAYMDDGNQIVWQLLAEDIVTRPNLVPKDGALAISGLPGLGFELNRDAVARAAEAYRKL